MRVVGAPIEGAQGWTAEVALAFVDATREEAAKYVQRRRLQRRVEEARQVAANGRASVADAARDATHASRELTALNALPLGLWSDHGIKIVGGVAGGSLLFLLVVPPLGVIGLLAAAIVAVVWNKKRAQEAAERDSRLRALRDAVSEAERVSNVAIAAAAAAEDQVAKVERAIAEIVPRRTLRGVARAYYPLSSIDVAGYPVLVDRSGAAPTVKLAVADLAVDAGVIDEIRGAIEEAKAMPVLLRPSAEGPVEVNVVHGEEYRLSAAVERFGEMLESVPTYEESLPLVEKTAPLARYIENNGAVASAMSVPGPILRSSDDHATARSVQRITDVSSRMRRLGRDLDAQMRGIQSDLAAVLDSYRDLRTGALGDLHRGIEMVMFRADLPHTNVYCPRCNRVPAYLFHRLGVDIDTAHELTPDAILEALQADEEARERLVSDEGLMAQIGQSWAAIRELSLSIDQLIAMKNASAAGLGVLDATRSFEARLRAMRGQRDQVLRQFRAALRKAVTGNARPLLQLSREAKLYLDPDTGDWQCAACDTIFDDPELARMGRMLRVKDELLMPMWNHLWTEKDDLRKTELFRTNEQIQRLVEKEAAALRDVSEQYRADMRPVRENMILSTTDAMTRREQLESTVQSLAVLGVMSSEQAVQSVSRLESMTGGDLANFKRRAEAKETLLNNEPQAQMSRRIPAIDPVEVLLTPEALFRHEATGREPVTLNRLSREEG